MDDAVRSNLFKLTLRFVRDLRLYSRRYWVIQSVYIAGTLVILSREHDVAWIHSYLGSQRIGHIKIWEMRIVELRLLLLMRHKAHKIFRVVT